MDDIEMKVAIRQLARRYGIDVLMLSDFGNAVHLMWNDFSRNKAASLGSGASDDELLEALTVAKSAGRAGSIQFVRALCGPDFAKDQAKDWLDGRGEQPTSSIPQPGATVMTAGGIGGKELALHILGHDRTSRRKVIVDLLSYQITVG
jgi:hypothetical protein